MPSVCIILVNYNGYKDTIECLKSISRICYDNYKVLVVDNDSTDGSFDILNKEIKLFEKVDLIKSTTNLGFSGGNNIAIKEAIKNKFDYICLLNNDTVVEEDFLNIIIDEMEKNKNVGIAAGKIMYFEPNDIIWSAGGFISEVKSVGAHYGEDEKDSKQYDDIKDVTFLTGCLQVIKREVLEKVGLYEDKYFLYMEDVDFCYRVSKAGYKLRYLPNSKIYHKVSASTGGGLSPLVLYYSTRNRLLFNKYNQEDFLKRTKFYLFFFSKLLIEPIRKKSKYKYMLMGVIDFIKGKDGKKEF